MCRGGNEFRRRRRRGTAGQRPRHRFDPACHDLLMDLKPGELKRIRSIVDELFQPLVQRRLDAVEWAGLFELEGELQKRGVSAELRAEHHADRKTARGTRQGK